jgi:hypothetical protein
MPRKPTPPPESTSPPPQTVADGLAALYPPDKTKVPCQICNKRVPDIAFHLTREHPKIDLAEYVAEFRDAPLQGEAAPKAPDTKSIITVSKKEAEKHPGGREGVIIERSLPEEERPIFRDNIRGHIDKGYDDIYLVCSASYYQVVSQRQRLKIEETRVRSGGTVVPAAEMAALDKTEEKVQSILRDLEKNRQARQPENEDPLAVVEKELIQAENWVRSVIGEFQHACPNCHAMLQPPALPHWAFDKIVTERGTEWPVWSPELWRMLNAGQIELWQMAYALRCSPEGLSVTAKRRGETWPAAINLEVEERKLRVVLEEQDRPQLPVVTTGA